MTSSIDLTSTTGLELGRMSADIATLAEQVQLQNEAINNAIDMACSAKNRSIDFSNRVVDLTRDIFDLSHRLRVWQNTCLVMAGWMFTATLLWAVGII